MAFTCYFFSQFKGDGVISASECINELGSEHAGDLIHPNRLTSTGYRAYMATMAQVKKYFSIYTSVFTKMVVCFYDHSDL